MAEEITNEDVLAQLKVMTDHLSRIQIALEDVVHLLGRSQISPS